MTWTGARGFRLARETHTLANNECSYDVLFQNLLQVYFDDGNIVDYDSVRTQIPITPTRALTFYKAQGLTLDRVLVRINSFRKGKIYKCGRFALV